MNKKFEKALVIYLLIGVVWATLFKFPFGIQLREYEGVYQYSNDITAVKKSYLTDNGDLVLCMQGRLSNSERYPAVIKDFSIVIPIERISNNKAFQDDGIYMVSAKSNILTLADKLIKKQCAIGNNIINVHVEKAEYTPKEASDFYSEKDLAGVMPSDGGKYMIFVVPTANEYPEWHFMEKVDIYLINNKADVFGREYYVIDIKRTRFVRDIGIYEYAFAFVKDALFYPFAIFMMGGWGH